MCPAWDIRFPWLTENQEFMLKTLEYIKELWKSRDNPEPDDLSPDRWQQQASDSSNWPLDFDKLRSILDARIAAQLKIRDCEKQADL